MRFLLHSSFVDSLHTSVAAMQLHICESNQMIETLKPMEWMCEVDCMEPHPR